MLEKSCALAIVFPQKDSGSALLAITEQAYQYKL